MGTLVNMRTIDVQPTPELAETIKARLAELMADCPHKGQRELAREIGVPAMVFNRAVNGKSTPAAAALIAIAEHFGVTTDWLLGMDGAPKKRRRTAAAR